jgi:hypothetical protein
MRKLVSFGKAFCRSVRSHEGAEAIRRWSVPNGQPFALIVKDWGARYSKD